MAKPMKTRELHYTMIQFLITFNICCLLKVENFKKKISRTGKISRQEHSVHANKRISSIAAGLEKNYA